jgi:hypothetical protein
MSITCAADAISQACRTETHVGHPRLTLGILL